MLKEPPINLLKSFYATYVNIFLFLTNSLVSGFNFRAALDNPGYRTKQNHPEFQQHNNQLFSVASDLKFSAGSYNQHNTKMRISKNHV